MCSASATANAQSTSAPVAEARGPPGAPGPEGPIGPPGPMGPQGPQGPQGPRVRRARRGSAGSGRSRGSAGSAAGGSQQGPRQGQKGDKGDPGETIVRTVIVNEGGDAGGVLGEEAASSNRVAKLRIKAGSGDVVRGLNVSLEGKRQKVRRVGANHWRASINLRGLERGIYVVRVTAARQRQEVPAQAHVPRALRQPARRHGRVDEPQHHRPPLSSASPQSDTDSGPPRYSRGGPMSLGP